MTEDAVRTFPRRHAATRRFTLGAPRSFLVSEDGETVLFLRSSSATDSANSLWRVDRGASARIVFDATTVGEGEISDAEKARRERAREQASGIVSYAATEDLATAVFVLGAELRRIDTATGRSEVLQTSGAVFDPRPNPDASLVAYVSGPGLRVTDGVGDRLIAGNEVERSVTWGSAEFVAAEEMGRSRGFWWSPGGERVAVTRVDTGRVADWWIASPEDPAAEPRPISYPAAGTANAEVGLYVATLDGSEPLELDWRQGRYEYLAGVQWKTSRILCTVQTRDQRTLAILAIDPDTGEVQVLQSVTDDHWVELVPGSPTRAGSALATVVDVGPARRLAIEARSVSADDVQVRRIVGTSHDDLIVELAVDPTTSVVARVTLSGELEALSDPLGWAGAATGGGTVVVSQATAGAGTSHEIRWHDGTVTIVDSLADEPGFPCTPEFAVVGSRELRSALFLPVGHDGSPLPVLMDPYGGPHAQRVVRVRNAHAGSQWFAEQGFAVVVVDGRGTPGRGPAFEREVWGDLAQPVLDDQVDALLALAAERTELDLSRVGIRGWSFGGYLAALAVLRRPDVFHAAVAGAPVTDWRLYDTHYTERYLGHPDEYPENYGRTALLVEADRLERPLMLIHGLADDNVVAAHTLTLSRALLEAGRPHEVLPLSGVTHMTPQEQVAENLLNLQLDFLRRHLVQPVA